ncbi:phage major tail protein, TP901-1 family [Streptococcus dysgalactiae subsp. dysgalactiae]|uniref:phage major tail protein, TP901-1 family n=1 Tax=Streptococcus dysgalactiae TaxID=1334 RepID=UPI001CF0F1D6|nr:phage major tail protein, TP901-1 family [Streptococcus dysgalactiae]MCB2836005.1 phage major tail protein, TP901-1 family [Streptococcus dysgalactiae subsp. dysgalactiae]
MTELIQGKSFLLFFRKLADAKSKAADKLKFQTEHAIKMEKETEATKTKDGIINSLSDGENTIDIKSFAYTSDEKTTAIWKELRKYFKAGDVVEIWQVDLTSKGSSDQKYEAEYFQGYFTSFEISAPADGQVELSITYAINGNGAEGKDKLTEEQEQAVSDVLYKYKSMALGGAEEEVKKKEKNFEM